jgi:hypothetical protein
MASYRVTSRWKREVALGRRYMVSCMRSHEHEAAGLRRHTPCARGGLLHAPAVVSMLQALQLASQLTL